MRRRKLLYFFIVILIILPFIRYITQRYNVPVCEHFKCVGITNNRSTAMKKSKFNKSTDDCSKEVINKMFKDIKIDELNGEEITHITKQNCLPSKATQCTAPVLLGPLEVYNDSNKYYNMYRDELESIRYGGWWSPVNCICNQTVAILIPFRNREQHLPVIVHHLHSFLKRHQIHYRIFVVEQFDKDTFNKGELINAGFKEIQKIFPYTCFIFQDVDLVPEDDRIDYVCKRSPMHLAAVIDKFGYTLHSVNAFGGVVSFKSSDYIRVNGFSNLFWAWGGEDDSLYQRVLLHGMTPLRDNTKIARYKMLKHENRRFLRTPQAEQETLRMLRMANEHAHADGLNSVVYQVIEVKKKKFYTWIKIDLLKSED